MKFFAIILNYNSSSDCRKCVADLQAQQDVDLDIIVVDNASRPEEREAAESLCRAAGCTFIASDENRGYNAGNNIGLRYAEKRGGEYAWVVNPDMRFPQRDYLKRALQVMQNDPSVAVLGTDILHYDGWHQNPWIPDPSLWGEVWQSLATPFRLLLRCVPPKETPFDYTISGYCEKLSGCCLLLRMEFLRELGFFDENLFLYCEEPVLSAQVRRSRWKMYYFAGTQALHHHVAAEKGDPRKKWHLTYRSRLYYLRHYSGFPCWVLWWLVPLKLVSWYVVEAMLSLNWFFRRKRQRDAR